MGGSLDSWPIRSSEPGLFLEPVKFVGGAGAVTKVKGRGVTVTYIGAGLVDLVFGEDMGNFLGVVGRCFEATVAAGLKGYTVRPGRLQLGDAHAAPQHHERGEALTDLAALQWLTLLLAFQRVNAGL
jgi:hypothetical protein